MGADDDISLDALEAMERGQVLADGTSPERVPLARQLAGLFGRGSGWTPTAPRSDRVARRAAILGGLRSWLDADAAGLARWEEWLRSVGSPPTVVAGWVAAMAGRWDDALGAFDAAARDPRQAALASASRALVHLQRDEVEEARSLSRRACRIARTDERLCDEYFANLVLARVRRHGGELELATRILSALGRVLPNPWRGWWAWEALLGGAVPAGGVSERGGPGSLAGRGALAGPDTLAGPGLTAGAWAETSRIASALTAAAARGDQVAAADLWASLAGCPVGAPFAADVRGLGVALGLVAPRAELAPWVDGATDDPPGVLRGLCVPEIQSDGRERAAAYVVATPTAPARRLSALGAALHHGGPLEGEPRAQSRGARALAALLLAGPRGLPDEQVFEAAFGFAYDRDRNYGVYRNLAPKVRQRLGERGSLERTDDGYRVELRAPIVEPDPRCTVPLRELVLRSMSTAIEGAGSRELADALQLPLRTVQAILGELVEEGACEVAKAGRKVLYRLEDTTFYEPSLTRLSGPGSEG